jgi:hypothetical protein
MVVAARNQDRLRRVEVKVPVEFNLSWISRERVLDGHVIPVAKNLIEILDHLFIRANDRNLQHAPARSCFQRYTP